MSLRDDINAAKTSVQSIINSSGGTRDMLIGYLALGPLLQAEATLEAAMINTSTTVNIPSLPPVVVSNAVQGPPGPMGPMGMTGSPGPAPDEAMVKAAILDILNEQ